MNWGCKISYTRSIVRWYSSMRKQIDLTCFPTLDECDLEEQHIRGSGPGGSKISTTCSCVLLKHIPTGLVVKCQETRFLEQNRKRARLNLLTKLDIHLNGENSVQAQTARLQANRKASMDQKKEKIRELKRMWKERENID
ncbi:hypothetical protein HUJ04_001575 [Dendroctonus ponderosae]